MVCRSQWEESRVLAALCGIAEIVPAKNADKAQNDATDSQTRLIIA
jgi:hypothetical protein